GLARSTATGRTSEIERRRWWEPRGRASGAGFERAAQPLADVALRQLVEELDVARDLVAREVRARVRDHVGLRELRVAAHDEQLHRFAGANVRHADGGDLTHPALRRGDILDLVRVDLEPGHDDHVLLPVLDDNVAVRVDVADVAGAKPSAVEHHERRLVGPPPIAGHHLRAAHADFADVARPERAARLVAYLDVRRRKRHADRPIEALDIQWVARHDG